MVIAAALIGVITPAAEAATLTATFTTTSNNGPYAPNNIVVVWVEGPGGTFVKTIGRWSLVRTDSLVAWRLKSGLNDVDAVTGATRSDHAGPLSVTWNLTDKQNAVIADGTYTVRMELADANSTQAAQNRQGTFTFVKSATAQMQANLASGGFTNVSINFDPTTAPPPNNPPPPGNPPPPSGGGGAGDAGTGSSYDAIEGGCSTGGGAGIGLAFALLALATGSSACRSRSR